MLKKWKENCFNLFFSDISKLSRYKYKISQELSILLPTDIVRLVSTYVDIGKSVYPNFTEKLYYSCIGNYIDVICRNWSFIDTDIIFNDYDSYIITKQQYYIERFN